MAKTLRTTMASLLSLLQAHGAIEQATIGEPMKPPEGFSAMVETVRIRSVTSTLTKTIETRTVRVRLYHKAALNAPDEEMELRLLELVDDLIEDFLGDFDFDGTIRAIQPVGIEVDWGYQTIQNIAYRVADITIPMTVDDSATFTKT